MKRVALPLILILGGAVGAQVPASLPASSPAATEPGAATAPSPESPVTQPTTEAAETALASTQVASTGPTTSGAPTTGLATGPTSRPFASSYSSQGSSSYRYSRSNRFGESPATPTSNYAADTAGMPNLTPKDYPKQYNAMLSRSIFIHGSQRVLDTWHDPNRQEVSSGNDSRRPFNPTPLAESVLVFNGASDVDGQLVAFIENTGMNQSSRYHVGDLVGQGAQGKIVKITLDSIDYQVGTKITHVMLGQNLYGQETQVLTTQPVSSGSTFSGSTGGTGPTTGSSSTSGGSPDSVLERLRRRRMQELGQ
jgi:hypothetical protein